MQLRDSSAINASILIKWPDTSHVCTLSKVNMADSSSTESSSTSESDYYWDTCGCPVIKCLCFFVVFFSSATKWKNCAIVPSGHWALNTMITNCDPMRCSHADHACYLDDNWRCHAQTGPGHMTNHEIFVYETLPLVVLYFNVFALRSSGALWRKRSKYLRTHTQVLYFAANPH